MLEALAGGLQAEEQGRLAVGKVQEIAVAGFEYTAHFLPCPPCSELLGLRGRAPDFAAGPAPFLSIEEWNPVNRKGRPT
jgi:hypothetical protein